MDWLFGKKDRIGKLNRKMTLVVVFGVVAAALLFVSLYRGGILGPIVFNNGGITKLEWSISDHTASNTPLENSLTGTDTPEYPGEVILDLQRKNDGSLEALPRYQGKLEYKHR